MLPPPARVAVFRALPGLGDVLCAVPALRAVRAAYPEARVTLIGVEATRPLALRFGRYVDEFLPFPGYPGLPEGVPDDAGAIVAFFAAARARRFDLAFQMHGSGGVTNPVVAQLGAKVAVGYHAPDAPLPPGFAVALPYPEDAPEVWRNLRLVAAALGVQTGQAGQADDPAFAFPVMPDDRRALAALLAPAEALALAPGDYAIVHPGASVGARRWPADRFAQVADALAARGLRVVLTGTAAESAITRAVAAAMTHPALDLAGRTDLGPLAALLADARLVLCNDTGVSHLAAALRVSSVVLFTASDPARWAPLDRARHRVLTGGAAVTVADALREVDVLLAGSAVGGRRSAENAVATQHAAPDTRHVPTADRRPPTADPAQRVLAVRLDNLGDVAMLGPALRAVKAALPGSHLTLLCSPAGAQVAPLLPWADETIVHRAVWQDASGALPLDPARERAFAEMLRAGNYDAALIFTSFSQSPWPPAYAAYLAGIPVRVGQSREFGGSLLTRWVTPPPDAAHQIDRNLHLVAEAGFAPQGTQMALVPPPEAHAAAEAALRGVGIAPGEPFAVLAPGASAAARRYDPARFARVAAQFAAHTGWPVVVVGSERDGERMGPVLDLAASHPEGSRPLVRSLVGKTDVPALVALIGRARLLFANDSGPMHFADALGVPMVILYSGTERESQWEPRHAPATLLRVPTPCAPCHLFECPYHMECLDIAPERVVEAAVALLAQQPLAVSRQPSVGRDDVVARSLLAANG